MKKNNSRHRKNRGNISGKTEVIFEQEFAKHTPRQETS